MQRSQLARLRDHICHLIREELALVFPSDVMQN